MTPPWAYVVGLTVSVVLLFDVLPTIVWWGEEVSAWLFLLHSTPWRRCEPRRQPVGGFRCACGRVGDSYNDFGGQGPGYVGLYRRVFTRRNQTQERIQWDAAPLSTREEGGRKCRDERG